MSIVDSVKWALDHYGGLVDRRGRAVNWRQDHPMNCQRPDRDSPKLKCGYPLPCPFHTMVMIAAPMTFPMPLRAYTDYTTGKGWLIGGYIASDGSKSAVKFPVMGAHGAFGELMAVAHALQHNPLIKQIYCDMPSVVARLNKMVRRGTCPVTSRCWDLMKANGVEVLNVKRSLNKAVHTYVRKRRVNPDDVPQFILGGGNPCPA